MATFVLIHGAWHGRWCWELVTPLLERRGHKVIAPDLPGMGDDPAPLTQVSVASWAEFVAELVLRQDDWVTLVGHSRAGIVISQAAELAHANLLGLIYLSAFLVEPGRTLEDTMRMIPPRSVSESSLVVDRTGTAATISPGALARVFYNTTPPALVARAAGLVGPEPLASFTTPAVISEERWGSVPRAYIECAEDEAIAPELQALMQARITCQVRRTLDCDHSPFFSAPESLATTLHDCVTELEALTKVAA